MERGQQQLNAKLGDMGSVVKKSLESIVNRVEVLCTFEVRSPLGFGTRLLNLTYKTIPSEATRQNQASTPTRRGLAQKAG